MSEMTNNTIIGNGAERARRTADRMADKASDTLASAKSAIHDTIDSVADRTTAATDWASDTVDSMKQAPSMLAGTGAGYIRATPYLAVGIAIAVGYLLGRAGR